MTDRKREHESRLWVRSRHSISILATGWIRPRADTAPVCAYLAVDGIVGCMRYLVTALSALLFASHSTEACERPGIDDALSVALPAQWVLEYAGGKGCFDTAGEFMFGIRYGETRPELLLVGFVVWGHIRPVYGDYEILDSTPEYDMYRVHEDGKASLRWVKKGETYTVSVALQSEDAETNLRVIAALQSMEVF